VWVVVAVVMMVMVMAVVVMKMMMRMLLVERVNDMVETVKHAIVLLQIAKNASCPGEDDGQLAQVHESSRSSDGGGEEGVEEARENRAETDSRSSLSSPRRSPAIIPRNVAAKSASLKNPSTIPAVSYSSSDDDEDDFFDAQDDVASKAGSDSGGCAPPPLPITTPSLVSPLTPSDVDWDALYEEDTEEGDLDMKSQGSVITHLLSQVRIGMTSLRSCCQHSYLREDHCWKCMLTSLLILTSSPTSP